MIGEELRSSGYENVKFGVPYPSAPRQRCDLCLMSRDGDTWVVEVKLLRFRGDNAQPNDNMLMHILSPYPAHRSALTDCDKLLASGFVARKAILIYGFDDDEWPLVPAIEAFEQLARNRVSLSPRSTAQSGALCHPVHKNASVHAWELL
jgi:hypothetical protein